MYWIVQENVCHEANYDEMIRSLERMEIPHSIHKIVPFSGEMIPEPKVPDGMKVWCMGSLSMHNICKEKGWSPGCVTLDHFDFQKQRELWKDLMLNYDAQIVSFEDIQSDRVPLFRTNFVRPLDDSKFVKGQIISYDDLYKWSQDLTNISYVPDDVSKDTLLLVAKPKHNIMLEARFWVVGHVIICSSLYKRGSNIVYDRNAIPEKMLNFAKTVVEYADLKYAPVETYCLDICELDEIFPTDRYKIVEINNLNSSGLYDCDVQKLIDALEQKYGT